MPLKTELLSSSPSPSSHSLAKIIIHCFKSCQNLFPQNCKALHAPSHQAGCRLGRQTGKAILNWNVKGEKLTLQHLPWWGIQRSACLKSIWAKFLCHFPSNLHCCCPPKMRAQRGRESKTVQSPVLQRMRQKQQSEAPVCWLIQPVSSHAADPARRRWMGVGDEGEKGEGKKKAEREESLPRIAPDVCKNGSFIRWNRRSQNAWVSCL